MRNIAQINQQFSQTPQVIVNVQMASTGAPNDAEKVQLRRHWFHRYHAFKLWHDLEYFGVQGPVVQVGYSAFKQWSHACAARFDIPVMAGILCVWPSNTDGADQRTDRELLRSLVQKLPYLWPAKSEYLPEVKLQHWNEPRHKIDQDVVRRHILLAHRGHQPFRIGVHVLHARPDQPLPCCQ